MNNIAIITDSCADLNAEDFKKNDVDVINMSIIFNEKEYEADVYWKNFDAKTLYRELREGTYIATLPATELNIRTVFEKHLKKGEDIVYIACPEKLSTTILKARKIANELAKDYPNQQVNVVDALNASCGQGILVLEACRLKAEGKDAADILDSILKLRNRVLQYCSPLHLTYLSQANKIKSYTASLGDLMNIKPIIVADAEGRQVSMKKIKGREACLNEIVRLLEKNVIAPEKQTLYIAQADDMKVVEHFKGLLEARAIHFKSIEVVTFGPVVGISVGPGSIAAFCYGQEISFYGE